MFLINKLNESHKIYQGGGHNEIITADKYNKNFVNDIISFADNV